MASSEFWQRVSTSVASSVEWAGGSAGDAERVSQGPSKLWILLDALTIVGAATLATLYEMHLGLMTGARIFWQGRLIHDRPMGVLLGILFVYGITLIFTSQSLQLYTPSRITSFLHEQRLSVQACLFSGLLLTGTLYLTKLDDVPRSIVLITVGLVTLCLSLRRLLYRFFLYRRFDRGLGTRNVLIVGTGPEAHALRHHLESIRHLGYTFKGFIDPPGPGSAMAASSGDVVGNLDNLFLFARRHFIDEIFFTTRCERNVVQEVLDKARTNGIDLRMIPDLYDGLSWNSPIEYIGQFPTIPLHCGHVPELGLVTKRGIDVLFSAALLLLLSPLILLIAIAVKLDSPGPIFYASERIGKKGRVFRCLKFRTMVQDAESRRAEVQHMNEREGVLFKITNDPRITRLGRLLRKYSLDELPQFFNVLRGDMSVVGPRPPIASEVREYNLSHLRRLDVMPGITGLWQVQGRQDPSFDSYISLDVTYIENWSVWLDIKIILRTIGVVFAGTGS
jgi:exopolysaccharide biosynthesis polyprenyl glycosylphosphotransferase